MGAVLVQRWLPAVVGTPAVLAVRIGWRAKPTAEGRPRPSQMVPDIITSDMGVSGSLGPAFFHVDPDYGVWIPALSSVESESGDLDLKGWATQTTGCFFENGIKPDPKDYLRIRGQLMAMGNQGYPSASWDPSWLDKWIHFPDCDDTPLPVLISVDGVDDDGSDDELRAALVGDPRVIDEPIVETVYTPLGRGLRAVAYTPLAAEGRVAIMATLAYVWRVEIEGDVTLTRLWTKWDKDRVMKAADDIDNLAMTLRLPDGD